MGMDNLNVYESILMSDKKEYKKSGPLSLPRSKRPRERLIREGPCAMSDEDLLSIILVSGVQGNNVSVLARKLLDKLDAKIAKEKDKVKEKR